MLNVNLRYISTLQGTQNFTFFFMSTYVFFNAKNDVANKNWSRQIVWKLQPIEI
jgi:hypothetical protein